MLSIGLYLAMADRSHADTFGSGNNTFTIGFVPVGNPGNANDTSGYGGVSYAYRMGSYEISVDQIIKATAGGLTNVPTVDGAPLQGPAYTITWYQAAAFVNWLNTSTGHQAAYDLTFGTEWSMTRWSSSEAWQLGGENLYRNKNAYYFLPSENEWYKAAYYDPNKLGGEGYWNYATGNNTAPTAVASGTTSGTAVYNNLAADPASVDQAGGLSPYGTMGQGGNVSEWNESSTDGLNNISDADRVRRGGSFYDADASPLSSSERVIGTAPTAADANCGFRVGSVPEPSSALLVIGAGAACLLWRRSRSSKSQNTIET